MSVRRKSLCGALVAVSVVAGVITFVNGSAQAGFTASVANPASSVGTATSFLTATNGSVRCTSVPSGGVVPTTAAFPCTGSITPSVPTTGTAVSTTTLAGSGTAAFSAASLTATSCGPVQLANSAAATNPMLVRGPVSFAQAGPLSGSTSLGLNGTNTLAADVVQRNGTANFSIGIWFKASAANGSLVSFATNPNEAVPTTSDRSIYFDTAGRLAFSVSPSLPTTIRSTKSYADGNWHYAVGTFASGGLTLARQTLYVDGVVAASNTNILSLNLGTMNYAGYWRVGQSNVSGGSLAGSGNYFNGSLSNASVWSSELTAAQVSTLSGQTTQAGLSSSIASLAPVANWTLGDNGLQTFAGPYPVVGSVSPCSAVRSTVGTAGKCVYPAQATACAAPTASTTLSGLIAAGSLALNPSGPTTAQALAATVARDTTYDTRYHVGLNILMPIEVKEVGFTQTFSWLGNRFII